MPRYAITEKAGPFVAGIRNCGVGTVLELSHRQAEHELRLGTLVALPFATANTAHISAPGAPGEDIAPVLLDIQAEPLRPRKPKRPTP